MGIHFYSIKGQGPRLIKTLKTGWVWPVMRIDNPGTPDEKWHLQGVATSEEMAVGMCVTPNYLIGPVPLDTLFPEGRMEWVGAYFPLASQNEQ